MNENTKLFSSKAIYAITFFFGPVAGGLMIRKNCLALDQEKMAKNILIISILFTILLFLIIFSLPESTIDKMPNIILPIAYALGASAFVKKIHGNELKEHKENNGENFSNWLALGLGLLGLLTTIAIVVSFVFLGLI